MQVTYWHGHDNLTLDRRRTTGSPSGVSSVGSENRSHFVAIPVSSSLSAELLSVWPRAASFMVAWQRCAVA